MTAPRSAPDTPAALSLVADVMALAGGDDMGPLVAALGRFAGEALGASTAVVVPAEEVDEQAARLPEPGPAVVALPLESSRRTLVVAGPPAAVAAGSESVHAVAAVATAALAHHQTLVVQRREAALGRAA